LAPRPPLRAASPLRLLCEAPGGRRSLPFPFPAGAAFAVVSATAAAAGAALGRPLPWPGPSAALWRSAAAGADGRGHSRGPGLGGDLRGRGRIPLRPLPGRRRGRPGRLADGARPVRPQTEACTGAAAFAPILFLPVASVLIVEWIRSRRPELRALSVDERAVWVGQVGQRVFHNGPDRLARRDAVLLPVPAKPAKFMNFFGSDRRPSLRLRLRPRLRACAHAWAKA
jgi:hypothetical protein